VIQPSSGCEGLTSDEAKGPRWNDREHACHEPLPWLISFSLGLDIMNKHILLSLIAAALLSEHVSAAGLPPWQFGMSKLQVASFKEFGPYKSFSNGDLETNNGRFHGRKTNVQLFFQGERLVRIGVYLYEGTDPKGGIPAWRSAYEALQKDYGRVEMPDIHVSDKSEPVNADVLAIAAAANADVTGKTQMAPAKQPPDARVFASFPTAMVQGRKWYYVYIMYDPKA